MTGDDDDWNVNAWRRQICLKVEAAQSPDVEDQATGNIRKLLCRNREAEFTTFTRKPTDRRRRLCASRTDGSLSMTKTIGVSVEPGTHRNDQSSTEG